MRAGLEPALVGATVLDVSVRDSRALKRHQAGPADFISQLRGARALAVVRRGKFLWLPLEVSDGSPLALVGHLGMSGQILLRQRGSAEERHERVAISFARPSEQTDFRFLDMRLFGGLQLDLMVPTADGNPGGFSGSASLESWWRNLIPSVAAHIARDPLDAHFDRSAVVNRLVAKQTGVKRALLDQNLLSGVGNIYADESLWLERLHFDRMANTISKRKAGALLDTVAEVLKAAVAQGGTSFDEQYKNVNGESGYFSVSLNAYGQTGHPCKRCGTPIVRKAWANRGSHFCPRCQRPH